MEKAKDRIEERTKRILSGGLPILQFGVRGKRKGSLEVRRDEGETRNARVGCSRLGGWEGRRSTGHGVRRLKKCKHGSEMKKMRVEKKKILIKTMGIGLSISTSGNHRRHYTKRGREQTPGQETREGPHGKPSFGRKQKRTEKVWRVTGEGRLGSEARSDFFLTPLLKIH